MKFRLFNKDWRQPTLAEPIEPLPSARLCLTAEFGMGSGRTTALWPPKIDFKFEIRNLKLKEQCRGPAFSEICTQEILKAHYISRVKSLFLNRIEWPKPAEAKKEKSDQAARPISISPLRRLLALHA